MIALSSPTTGEFGLAPVKRYSRAAHATSNSLSFVPVLTDFGYCSTTRVALSKELQREREKEKCRAFAVPDSSCLSSTFHLTFQSFYHLSSNLIRDWIESSLFLFLSVKKTIYNCTSSSSEIRSQTFDLIPYKSFRFNLINSLLNSLIVCTASITLVTSGVYLVTRETSSQEDDPILDDPIDRSCIAVSGRGKKGTDRQPELYILFLEYITSLSKLCRGCERGV